LAHRVAGVRVRPCVQQDVHHVQVPSVRGPNQGRVLKLPVQAGVGVWGCFLYQVKWYQCTCQVRCCLPLSLPVEAPAPRVCDLHMSEAQYDALRTLDIVFTLAPAESRRRTTMRCKRDAAMSRGDVPCWGVTRSKSAPGQQATGQSLAGDGTTRDTQPATRITHNTALYNQRVPDTPPPLPYVQRWHVQCARTETTE
jgi:hypothetical protein